MNNLDWLCENDREQLMKLLAEGDSCEYCALDIEDDCGVRCNEGVRAWLEADHNDGLEPENGVSDPDGGSNVAYIAQDTREKLEDDIHEFRLRYAKSNLEFVAFEYCVRNWLNRQKAITKREQAERIRQLEQDFQTVKDDRDDCCRKIAKLTVERDNLETRLSNCQDRIRQLEAERDKQSEHIRQLKQVVQADKEDCAQSFADMKVMENQRDRARAERDKYRGQRDLYRKKLGDAVWHAQAIARMTEVDA